MTHDVDASARIVASDVGSSELREFVTVHDSVIGDDCRIYERCSIKKSRVGSGVDINAGSYVENASIEETVQIGPNSSVVGVSHRLDETGMEHRNDTFDEISLNEGAFVGAGAVINPGVEVGADAVVSAGATVTKDVPPETVVVGSPPEQRVVNLARWVDR
jgi:acetyltransferase-like isoleucine patch superfamily enzyme